jgi:hypothetical protein
MQFLPLSVDEELSEGMLLSVCYRGSSGFKDCAAGNCVWQLPETFQRTVWMLGEGCSYLQPIL